MNQLGTNRSGGHMVDFLFTLALFCVFAASSLLVVVIGANVYQNTVNHMELNYGTNTSITYVTTKIRQHDAAGAIYLDQLGTTEALVLEQQLGEQVYQTWIYYYDHSLYELYTQRDNAQNLTPLEGQAIVPVEHFSFEQVEDGLFRITAEDENGRRVGELISLRS